MGSMTVVAAGFGLLLACVFAIVSVRPQTFWPVVIVCAVVFSGIVVAQISYLDEMVVGVAVLGVVFCRPTAARRWPERLRSPLVRVHEWVFLVTCAYMSLQATRGLAITGSFRKIRFVLFFVLIAYIAGLMARGVPPIPRQRRIAALIAIAGSVYFTIYSLVGLVFRAGMEKADLAHGLQNQLWGGTTYAAFVLVALVPAAILLLRDGRRGLRWLAWLSLGVAVWQGFYFDSRCSWLAFIGFFILAIPVLGGKRSIALSALFLVVLWLFLSFYWPDYYDVAMFGQMLTAPFETIAGVDTGRSNMARFAHTQIGFEIVQSDSSLLFFGTGLRASDPLVAPALFDYYTAHGFGSQTGRIAGYTSTVGFTTLLIETGAIGVALYLGNFLLTAREILQCERTTFRYVLLGALGMAGLWTFVTNPMDIVVFHLIIMPSGLLVLLSGANAGPMEDPKLAFSHSFRSLVPRL